MRIWIVGAIAMLALPAGLQAQHVEVHASVRVSDRVAIDVHYGTPQYQPGVFMPAPLPPRYTYRSARAQRYSKAHRKAMQVYERELRKFEREHQKAHRLGIPHMHVRGGIQYSDGFVAASAHARPPRGIFRECAGRMGFDLVSCR